MSAQILRCEIISAGEQACKANLHQETDALVCVGCGRAFPLLQGVTRFVDARTQLDTDQSHRSEVAFRRRTGFCPDDFAGKLVLDVGCGMGRFAEVATRWGARVVAVDLSLAAEVAAQNLADRSATFFQADLFNLPFATESFDYIYSMSHHTPDCERAFKMLPALLKPGGRIAIWLYSGYNRWYRISDLYRNVTRCMPRKLLHTLCYGVVLYGVHQLLRRIPLIGRSASGMLAY